jgi:hypothetical protein
MNSKQLLEQAWGIICNAGGGDWNQEKPEWKKAAETFRADYFTALNEEPAPREVYYISSKDLDSLARRVNDFIQEGWFIDGDLVVNRGWFSTQYIQLLVNYNPFEVCK